MNFRFTIEGVPKPVAIEILTRAPWTTNVEIRKERFFDQVYAIFSLIEGDNYADQITADFMITMQGMRLRYSWTVTSPRDGSNIFWHRGTGSTLDDEFAAMTAVLDAIRALPIIEPGREMDGRKAARKAAAEIEQSDHIRRMLSRNPGMAAYEIEKFERDFGSWNGHRPRQEYVPKEWGPAVDRATCVFPSNVADLAEITS